MSALLEQIDRYNNWAEHNSHSFQISHMRSGKHWLSSLIKSITTQHGFDTVDSTRLDSEPGLYEGMHITSHYYDQLRFFDTAKYILLVRDPRDATLSFFRMAEHKRQLQPHENPMRKNEDWWSKCCDGWESYFTSGVLERDTITIQYEHLCLEPTATLNKVVHHTGMNVVNGIDGVLRLCKYRDDSFVEPDVKYYNEHCVKWRDGLAEDCSAYIWDRLSARMSQYGYTEFGQDIANGTDIQ